MWRETQRNRAGADRAAGRWNRIPITYAGGIRSLEDIEQIRKAGQNKIHITVGSALDLYGGDLPFEKVLAACEQ